MSKKSNLINIIKQKTADLSDDEIDIIINFVNLIVSKPQKQNTTASYTLTKHEDDRYEFKKLN